MLQEGDIVEIEVGMKVYADVPQHFLYANKKGNFEMAHGEVVIRGELSHMAGRYVVYETVQDGGGTGMGPHDVYPSGHHVFCEKLDESGAKLDFYQSGSFTAMLPDLKPVGRASRKWVDA